VLPQQQMLPPQPFHIATKGRWGGVYGIATRGYLVLPDIVPRFPAEGVLEAEKLVAWFTEEGLEATLDSVNWTAVAKSDFDVEGLVESLAWLAAMEAQDIDGVLAGDRPFGGEVEQETDPWAEIAPDDEHIAEIEEADDCAEIEECSDSAALVEKPGQGKCRRD